MRVILGEDAECGQRKHVALAASKFNQSWTSNEKNISKNPHTAETFVKPHGIPPTAVGGSFRYGLQQKRPAPTRFFIPLPSRREGRRQNGISRAPLCRLDLNDPPTAVGGIPKRCPSTCVCRLA